MSSQQQMERTVLGSMLLDEPALAMAAEMEPTDFSLDSNRKLFARMLKMHQAEETVNVETLCFELARTGHIEDVGGRGYIFSLTEDIPRNYRPVDYVNILRSSALDRKLDQAFDLGKSRLATGELRSTVAEFMYSELLAIENSSHGKNRPQPAREWVDPTFRELEQEFFRADNTLAGISTGLPSLDEATTGWRKGELTYVGAMPGRGKTAFLLQNLYHAASNGIPCGLISLEMRREKLMRRLTVMHGNHTANQLQDPKRMSKEQYWAALEDLAQVGKLPIFGTDVSGLSPAKISLCARQMHELGAQIIFVDFVQIIQEDGHDRREAINRVSAALRDTCKRLNIPFVVASQLSRRDNDINRRPTMMDLRESGNLEQDAARVLLLYRPQEDDEFTGEDEIIIAKQREGWMGHIDVRYNGNKFRFEER